jgi:hypothetical protein
MSSSSRSARQAEIDAIMAEMMTTAPAVKHHPAIKVHSEHAPELVEGAVVVAEDESESDSEDEDEVEPRNSSIEAKSTTVGVTGHGEARGANSDDSGDFGPQPVISGAQSQDDTDVVEDYAVGKRIPVSHQVLFQLLVCCIL